jgi:FkbM family methyltransferase
MVDMNTVDVRRRLVGTGLGRFLVHVRQSWGLWRTLGSNPEQGGHLAQDVIAQELLPRLCRASAVFVDIGAHIGSVIAEVQRCDPSVRIIAVEAVPEKAAHLARAHPGVTVHGVALGEKDGEVRFFVNTQRPGYSSLANTGGRGDAVVEITVPMRKLDDLVPPPVTVDVMKVDVEGAELGVLRGAAGLVARSRPVIMFESAVNTGAALGYSVEALFDWLAERDYQVLVPNRVAHDGPTLGREGFLEAHYYPFRTLNYFAVPRERRVETRDRARRILGIGAGS